MRAGDDDDNVEPEPSRASAAAVRLIKLRPTNLDRLGGRNLGAGRRAPATTARREGLFMDMEIGLD